MSEGCCPCCKRSYPNGWRKAMRKRQSEAIKAAAKIAEKWGRPRETDYTLIRQLRADGMSLNKIANRLHCSRGTIQHAFRKETK